MADYLTDEWITQQQQRLDAAHEQVLMPSPCSGVLGTLCPGWRQLCRLLRSTYPA